MDEPKITREQAVQIARQVCDERGWPWHDPPAAWRRWRWWGNWVVYMDLHPEVIPTECIEIIIDAKTGEVIEAKHLVPPM